MAMAALDGQLAKYPAPSGFFHHPLHRHFLRQFMNHNPLLRRSIPCMVRMTAGLITRSSADTANKLSLLASVEPDTRRLQTLIEGIHTIIVILRCADRHPRQKTPTRDRALTTLQFDSLQVVMF